MSPGCKHLTQSDETNQSDGTLRTIQQNNIGESYCFQDTTPETRLNHSKKQAGFTLINSVDKTYKRFSCLGTYQNWQQADDPWKIHAQQFPY